MTPKKTLSLIGLDILLFFLLWILPGVSFRLLQQQLIKLPFDVLAQARSGSVQGLENLNEVLIKVFFSLISTILIITLGAALIYAVFKLTIWSLQAGTRPKAKTFFKAFLLTIFLSVVAILLGVLFIGRNIQQPGTLVRLTALAIVILLSYGLTISFASLARKASLRKAIGSLFRGGIRTIGKRFLFVGSAMLTPVLLFLYFRMISFTGTFSLLAIFFLTAIVAHWGRVKMMAMEK